MQKGMAIIILEGELEGEVLYVEEIHNGVMSLRDVESDKIYTYCQDDIKHAWVETFKVQRSFNDCTVLIYNEDRSIMGRFAVGSEIDELFGEENKIYVWGYYEEAIQKVNILCKLEESDECW